MTKKNNSFSLKLRGFPIFSAPIVKIFEKILKKYKIPIDF